MTTKAPASKMVPQSNKMNMLKQAIAANSSYQTKPKKKKGKKC